MIRLDFIPKHQDLKIYQDDEMFLINSDTEALGEFLNIYRNDNVLDMGTNTGGLLLYASLFNPKSMTGIDINTKALELAKKNMEINDITNCRLIEADITTYSSDPYDVVICNPPYFKTEEDNKADNNYKNLAKHEADLTLKVLIKSISRNLKDNGTLFFLYLTSRLEEVVLELNANNIAIKEMKFIYDENKKYSNVFVIRGVKNAKKGMNVLKPYIFSRNK